MASCQNVRNTVAAHSRVFLKLCRIQMILVDSVHELKLDASRPNLFAMRLLS
jgi:hypothetical protein